VLSAALGLASLLWAAYRSGQPLIRWLDCGAGAIFCGVIGARAMHVALESNYFSAHTDQIWSLANGGLDWHGAVFGGLIGLALVAGLRRVPFGPLTDAVALVFPLGAALIWAGSGSAATAYGLEVGTLADFPAWLVTESPDIYGAIAPRLDLPHIGIALCLAVWGVVLALTVIQRGSGLRLWISLGALGLLMAILSFFRGDLVTFWFDHRADQVLDLLILLLATLLAAVTLIAKSARGDGQTPQLTIKTERTHTLGHVARADGQDDDHEQR